jgi:hypothetical protein
MKGKIGGLLIALVLLGLGGHMLYAPKEYSDTSSANTSGRKAIYKKALKWSIDNVGVMPTGLILAAGGGLVGFVTLKPKRDPEA